MAWDDDDVNTQNVPYFFVNYLCFFLKTNFSYRWMKLFCFDKDCNYLFICSHGQNFTTETLHLARDSFLYFKDSSQEINCKKVFYK